ncbi:AfsR/SARP family transcriptional regulator [Sphingomonas sp. ERG5]|uniref:AfsR/SARP family transcriptional regulator n=1 Tax=Sphingomonas sp. ERG5 TaxID=1381597 RepID=UPI00054BBE63|nr:BTAD domain-containing putative transcriptional regulator [Sphingomonas sp. ERG5]
MAPLNVRLLGGFALERDGAVVALPPTPKSRLLLAYLILNRDRLIHREIVCATLWPDESEAVARKALRTALWRIRSALEGEGGEGGHVYSDAYQLGFRGDWPVWIDLWAFEDTIAMTDAKADDALQAADGVAMTIAAQLYRGDCAAGLHDEWLAVEQERLHNAYLTLVERVADFHARRQSWLLAISWAERALVLDPLREHLHRAIMACHLSMGDRPSALRQYARCERALRDELGITPMAETVALREALTEPCGGERRNAQPKVHLKRTAKRVDASIADALAIVRRTNARSEEPRATASSPLA